MCVGIVLSKSAGRWGKCLRPLLWHVSQSDFRRLSVFNRFWQARGANFCRTSKYAEISIHSNDSSHSMTYVMKMMTSLLNLFLFIESGPCRSNNLEVLLLLLPGRRRLLVELHLSLVRPAQLLHQHHLRWMLMRMGMIWTWGFLLALPKNKSRMAKDLKVQLSLLSPFLFSI